MLTEEPTASLRNNLRGELIEPSDARYDEARKVYNGMIDRRPRIIARCADVADVIAAVNFGREHKLLIAVRSGGHNAGGLGVCDDGLVIDLSHMNYVRVDPKRRSVLVGGGALLGAVDHATHAFGLAVPSGILSTTGVGGLTLGGGLGHLTRQCGLTIDNLLAVDIVLADGSFVTANSREHSDLFWAVRGGWRQFRCCDIVSVQSTRHPYGLRGADALGVGRRSGDDALVPQLYPEGAEHIKRLFRFPNSSARTTVSRTSAQQENVRHCVVLHWAS
jgi:FAD/FMN-containing dehydrogenase